MKPWIALLVAVGLTLQTGCRKNESPTARGDGLELLARWHFVGTETISKSTNAAKLTEIWKFPETQRLAGQTFQKLSHAPRTLFRDSVDAARDERGAAMLQPLIEEFVRVESFVQVRGKGDRPAEWTLLVHLPDGRARAWVVPARVSPLQKLDTRQNTGSVGREI